MCIHTLLLLLILYCQHFLLLIWLLVGSHFDNSGNVAETGSEDEAVDLSEDDFFMGGSSSDDVDADDEWTDKSPRWRPKILLLVCILQFV